MAKKAHLVDGGVLADSNSVNRVLVPEGVLQGLPEQLDVETFLNFTKLLKVSLRSDISETLLNVFLSKLF